MNLDILKIEEFRDLINCSTIQNKLIKSINWNKLCASMDSINVAVAYIWRIYWEKTEPLFAFQLFELITAGQMIKNGIYEIINVFRINNPLKIDNSIFNIENKNDDDIFSEYRALSFVHTLDFRENNHFANNSESFFAWCFWADYENKIATVNKYSREYGDSTINIYYNQVYKYIEKRYNYLDEIIKFVKEKY